MATGTQVTISVNLDAAQATTLASQLGQQLAKCAVNGTNIDVGNPAQARATTEEATRLNATLKQILISIQRINISLAKSGKITLQLNRNAQMFKDSFTSKRGDVKKGSLFEQLSNGFDDIIKKSEETIQTLQTGVSPALEEITKPAEEASDAVKDVGDKAKQAAEKTQKTVNTTNKKMKGQIKTLEAILKSFFSPITIALVAFETAVKTFTYFWDNLTQSVQKMTTRGQNVIKVFELKKKKMDQETKAAQSLIQKLEELNNLQMMSANEQKLAQSIVAKLNKQYKDLGITLNQTTGKYQGLYKAQIKLDQRNRNVQKDALTKQIQGQRDVINAALKTAFGEQINIGQMVNGNQFFTLAERLGKTLGAQNADMLARKWNTGNIEKQLEVIDQLLNGLSSGDTFMKNGTAVRDAMQTLINYRNQLQDLNSVDTQIIDANTRLAESFKKFTDAIKASKDNIKSLEEQLQKIVDDNNYNDASLVEKIGLKQSQVDRLDKEIEDNLKRIEQLKKQLNESQVYDSDGEALNYQQYKYQKLKEKTNKLEEEYNSKKQKYEEERNRKLNKLQRERDKLIANPQVTPQATLGPTIGSPNAERNKRLADIEKQISQIDKNEEYKKLNQTLKDLEATREKLTDQEAKYQASKQKDLELQKQIAALEEEVAQGRITREQASIEAQKLQQQYRTEQLEAERKLRQQEQQRIDNYNDYVNGLFRKQSQTLNEILGKKKQSLMLETQLNAQKILGRKLTEEELDKLKEYVQLDSLINQYKTNQKLDIGKGTNVITNQIASKGGYASSIVVDRSVDINKQILDVQKSQADTLKQIKNLTEKNSVIQ